MGAYSKDAAIGWWSLYLNPEGTAIYFSAQAGGHQADYLKAPIEWQAGVWHEVLLSYDGKESVLYLDGEVAAIGSGVWLCPPDKVCAAVGFTIGGTGNGDHLAQGEFEELTTYSRPKSRPEAEWLHQMQASLAARGPISPEEEQAQRDENAKWKAEQKSTSDGGGAPMMLLASQCVTNVPVYITNIITTFDTNWGWTVYFDINGGQAGIPYDVFTTTNLVGNSFTNAQWAWLTYNYTCQTVFLTNQPAPVAFYVLGEVSDPDDDGLSTAFEQLVSKTDPNNSNTDGDDMDDYYEVLLGRNPNQAGWVADSGGVVNLETFVPRR